MDKPQIFSDYIDFVQSNHQLPTNISDINALETDGYQQVHALVADIWKFYAETTLENCAEDPAFGEYTAREKYLAYCYTLIEVMKSDRDVIQLQLKKLPSFFQKGDYKGFKQAFETFTEILISEGTQRGEIQARPFVASIYPTVFWLSIVSVITFWINDDSESNEQTDVAIEKIVHLVFDSIAPNALDSAFDLLQFLVKQRLNG